MQVEKGTYLACWFLPVRMKVIGSRENGNLSHVHRLILKCSCMWYPTPNPNPLLLSLPLSLSLLSSTLSPLTLSIYHLSIHPSLSPYISTSIHPPIHPSVYLFTYWKLLPSPKKIQARSNPVLWAHCWFKVLTGWSTCGNAPLYLSQHKHRSGCSVLTKRKPDCGNANVVDALVPHCPPISNWRNETPY